MGRSIKSKLKKWRGLGINKFINKNISIFILKLFLLITYFISFQYLRLWVIIILFVLFIIDIVKKNKQMFLFDLLIILITLLISVYPLYASVECARFFLLEGCLNHSVEKIIPELLKEEDTYWDEYSLNGISVLSLGNKVLFRKIDNSIAIFFVTNNNSFSGYLYTSDINAMDLMKYPSRYWPQYTKEDNMYSSYKQLNTQWAYLKLYH